MSQRWRSLDPSRRDHLLHHQGEAGVARGKSATGHSCFGGEEMGLVVRRQQRQRRQHGKTLTDP